jgi:tetratricopeptide (TPR) repeat protein
MWLLLALALPAGAQDWAGYGRLEGRVLDERGQPVAQARVKLRLPERGGRGPSVVTDRNGRWAVAGISAGNWELDYEAEGFARFQGKVRLAGESARLPPLEVRLARGTGEAGVPKDVLDTLARAEAAEKAGQLAQARAEYEKLAALRPEVAAVAEQRIGAALIQEKQYGPALEHLGRALVTDPENATLRVIMVQAAFAGGLADRALELLRELQPAAVRDSDTAYNLGVQLVNAGRQEGAVAWFSRAIELAPGSADGHLRRGLALLGLGRAAEARSDFAKVLELEPKGPQAELARKAMEQIG